MLKLSSINQKNPGACFRLARLSLTHIRLQADRQDGMDGWMERTMWRRGGGGVHVCVCVCVLYCIVCMQELEL